MRTLKITTIVIGLIALMLTFAFDATADTVTWTNDSTVSTGPTRGFKSPEVKRENLIIEGTGDAASLVIGDAGVARWMMDEGGAETILNDFVGPYTATISGGATWGSGEIGHPVFLTFDGVNSYVTCGDVSELNATSAFTIMTWVKVANDTKTYYVCSKEGNPTTTYNILMTYSFGSVNCAVSNGEFAYGGCTAGVAPGTWFHLALVYNGSGTGNSERLKIYINGNKKSLGFNSATIPSSTPNLSGNPFYIGANVAQAPGWFDGSLDDFHIYKRALSDAEINADKNGL